MDSAKSEPTRFVKFISVFLHLAPIVLLMLALSACSKAALIVPMPQPPANLASNCPAIPAPPMILIDPDRAVWESDLIAKYQDCAVKHRLTVDAWRNAINAQK